MSNKLLTTWPYCDLDLDRFPQTKKDIKRAYARKLKTIDQSQDIEGFQKLHQAYQHALHSFEHDLEEHSNQSSSNEDEESELTNSEFFFDNEKPANLKSSAPSQDEQSLHTDDVATPDTNIEEENDGAAIQALFDELISEKSQENWDSALKVMLSNPLIVDPEIMSAIEAALFDFLYENLTYIDDTDPSLPDWVTAQAVKTLNSQFEWVDDYVYLTNKFWNADTMMLALTARHKTLPIDQGGKKEPIFQNLSSLWGIKGLWIVWFGTVLLSLIFPSTENSAKTSFQVSIMLLILIVFYYIIKYSVKLFFIVSTTFSTFLDNRLQATKHASVFKDLIAVTLLIAFSISVVVAVLAMIPR